MISYFSNFYILIGVIFVMVLLLQSKCSLFMKVCITVALALTVAWFEKPHWFNELWLWKIKTIISQWFETLLGKIRVIFSRKEI